MGGYKVRLDDGSEIGPMDLAAVRSWFGDGLINSESLVLAPGSRRWAPLKQAIDIRSWGGPSVRSGARKGQPQEPEEVEVGASLRERLSYFFDSLRVPLAGVLLIAGAGLAGFWAAWPAQQRTMLHDWPWPQIGLGLLALGLCLFVRPRITRPLVFGALLLAATAALATIGMLVVQKAPLTAYVVLGGGILACFGFLAMLEGAWASSLRTILGTLLVVAGFGAAFKYGYVAASEAESAVYAWTLSDAEITDTRVGMRFHVPSGWRFVKPNAPFIAAPAGALARFASVDGTTFAYLVADRVPPGVVQLETLSERAVASRRVVVSSLRALERAAVQVGSVPGSRVTAESGDFSSPTIESLTLWRDGFTLYTLVGWAPGGVRAETVRRFDLLATGFESLGGQGTQVSDAVRKAAEQVPFLTPGIVERLMSASDAGVLEPPEIFKRALILAGRGVPRLEAGEVKELQGLLDLAYRNMDKRDRKRLADYLAAVRGTGASDPALDREMCSAMAAAVMQLPMPARERLQALYEQTIIAAWTDGATVR